MFIPLLPGEIATGALAAMLAVAYTNLGLPVLFGAIVVLLIFQYLAVALLRSEDRADQLEARSIQLASLQFGVLATLMDALALRDHTTARHAAAVARYAKALAIEIGCSEAEQEVIHTAGLLHDIGKFTWSDRVLHPERLTDADLAVIRRHPQDGATLVGKLDGYGPVADAILYHHERIDGGGYPAGLIGNEIPLGVADRRDLLHLRHDDRARDLSFADDARRRQWPSCGRSPAANSTASSSRASSRCSSARGPTPSPQTDAATSRPSSRSSSEYARWPSRPAAERPDDHRHNYPDSGTGCAQQAQRRPRGAAEARRTPHHVARRPRQALLAMTRQGSTDGDVQP